MICSNTGQSIIGYSNQKFINGNLRKHITTNTLTYHLPVGNGNVSNNYHLAEFINNNLAGVSAINVSVSGITEGGNNIDSRLDPTKAIQDGTVLINALSDAEWNIGNVGSVTGGSYGINLYVDNISELSSADDFEFCILKRTSNSTDYADWDAFDATTTIPSDNQGGRTYITYDGGGMPIGSGYAQCKGYTSFSKFIIAKSRDEALPIELLSFTATLDNNNIVDLYWSTSVEINNDYFTVEKAIENSNSNLYWSFVLTKKGAGNSNEIIEYNDFDANPYKGISYYRLKQTDFDGNYKYSKIVAINNNQHFNNDINLTFISYPNPSLLCEEINIYNIEAYKPLETLTFEVFDMLNKIVISEIIFTDENGFFTKKINKNNELKPGMYIVKITATTLNNKKELDSHYKKIIVK
jgi:hypothetical protein